MWPAWQIRIEWRLLPLLNNIAFKLSLGEFMNNFHLVRSWFKFKHFIKSLTLQQTKPTTNFYSPPPKKKNQTLLTISVLWIIEIPLQKFCLFFFFWQVSMLLLLLLDSINAAKTFSSKLRFLGCERHVTSNYFNLIVFGWRRSW